MWLCIIKIFDAIVIGAGISGASVSSILEKRKISHLIVDKKGICSGASFASGAFLFYKLFSSSPINILSNKAYLYSLNFYKNNNINLTQSPSFYINKVSNEIKLNTDATASNMYNQDGYLLNEGYLLDPETSINKLINKNNFMLLDVQNIKKENDIFIINNKIKSKKIIITSGADDSFTQKYLKIRKISGLRIELESLSKNPYNIHGEVSISSNTKNKIIIGSSNHRNNHNLQKQDIPILINKAKNIMTDLSYKSISYRHGIRACSTDYFPYVGELINEEKTIKENANIINGAKIKKFHYQKDIYVLKGLASKGFSMSPYLANKLCEFIYENKKIEDNLSLERRFVKYIRKNN